MSQDSRLRQFVSAVAAVVVLGLFAAACGSSGGSDNSATASSDVTVKVAYGAIGALQQLWPEFDAELLEQRFDVEAEFCLRVPRIRLSAMERAIQNVTRGAAVITRMDTPTDGSAPR